MGYADTQASRHETLRAGDRTVLVVYHEGGRVDYALSAGEARGLAEELLRHARECGGSAGGEDAAGSRGEAVRRLRAQLEEEPDSEIRRCMGEAVAVLKAGHAHHEDAAVAKAAAACEERWPQAAVAIHRLAMRG